METDKRNPLQCAFSDSVLARTPHANRVVWSYKCPAKKRGLVELLTTRVQRSAAATAAGVAEASIAFKPSAGSATKMVLARIITNNVGDVESVAVSQSLSLMPFDEIVAVTRDSSTGGGCDFDVCGKIVEFDA